MSPEIEQGLVDKYPGLFVERSTPRSCMAYGCECGDGWAEILRSLCFMIAQRMKNRGGDFRFTQIKEKFGLLRIYGSGGDDYISGLIAMAEAVSGTVCDTCGDRGSVRRGGWLMTLCDKCHAEHIEKTTKTV